MTESIDPGKPLSLCPDCSPQDKDCALFAWPCPFRLDNELALITGGGSGLGLAMARCMADAGARVLLAGRREEVLQQAVESIGPRANYLCHDVNQLREAPALVAKDPRAIRADHDRGQQRRHSSEKIGHRNHGGRIPAGADDPCARLPCHLPRRRAGNDRTPRRFDSVYRLDGVA